MPLGLIWAQTPDGVIGAAGRIPWSVPEDLARFRELTTGGTVIMGRKTWESLPQRFRPLPDRRNIVVTRSTGFAADGAEVAHSLDEALLLAGGDAWVIGGGELYREAIGRADRLEVTEVEASVDGDTFAPPIAEDWTPAGRRPEWAVSSGGLRYRFLSFGRPKSTE